MKKQILIIDDDFDLLYVLHELFRFEGYKSIGFNHGNDIENVIRAHKPDLILLDYLLPGFNGGEICSKLKSLSEYAMIPVIIFSAHSDKGIKNGSYGCDYFISKPFDLEPLMLVIERLINKI
ncbi:response regulator [Mucilaginibacter ginkgonis]|uniref:Response regulator n=1 Tax=Mucilaginibacter ginkgonis TaxID=2682091 RepID=A0A6I4HWK3_9SPHI|nr:response regulator [Mucilaginibacter ginkgonis]QQL51216.1 response regulator [Mucilaginibacter ginkgonis]